MIKKVKFERKETKIQERRAHAVKDCRKNCTIRDGSPCGTGINGSIANVYARFH